MTAQGVLLIFGLGYTGRAVADAAARAGFEVWGTTRSAIAPDGGRNRGGDGTGIGMVAFDAAGPAIARATHILATAAPDAAGDPVLARHAPAIAAAPRLRWIGYLSSTVVYGNRDGGWVTEDTPPAPTQDRGHRRLAAETAWRAMAGHAAVDLLRLAGIYGPGRSVLDDLRAGRARRLIKPGHQFGRIHRDDIARATLAAMRQDRPPGTRVLNLTDDAPAESAAVAQHAAALLGIAPPPGIAFDAAVASMTPMARSFWAENRKVACAATKAALGLEWLYPTYREGLRAILADQRGDRPA